MALREGLDGATNYNINVPTLKRLDIDVESDYQFEIYAPALHYFRFFGDLGNLVFLEKLTNLVEAHVYIYFMVLGIGFLKMDYFMVLGYSSLFEN